MIRCCAGGGCTEYGLVMPGVCVYGRDGLRPTMAIMAIRINRWIGRLSRVTSGGNFIPEIDGLRFLAIGSVLLFHVNYSLSRAYHWTMKPWEQTISNALSRGTLGVELFFVISGFILAQPFVRQRLLGGQPVSIRGFYKRRLTRLEPPYILS